MGFQVSPYNRKKRFYFGVIFCLLTVEYGTLRRDRSDFILGCKIVGMFDFGNQSLQAYPELAVSWVKGSSFELMVIMSVWNEWAPGGEREV